MVRAIESQDGTGLGGNFTVHVSSAFDAMERGRRMLQTNVLARKGKPMIFAEFAFIPCRGEPGFEALMS